LQQERSEAGYFHPPITTSASMVSEARTKMVSKEASFIMPSASYPAATLIDSIHGRHGDQLHGVVSSRNDANGTAARNQRRMPILFDRMAATARGNAATQ
jgi:hypothetical protein